MSFSCKVFLFFVFFIIAVGIAHTGPWEAHGYDPSQDRTQPSPQENGLGSNVGAWFAGIFRDHISKVDGDRCPSLPTCSSYSFECFKKHGFFMGWLMTVDRLIHEADEASVSPLKNDNGELKILDPVTNNDFWWFHQDGKDGD
jgi:putative component of membrane protein insertase Oxa1/YidC/SpoIIIJ protein YidD